MTGKPGLCFGPNAFFAIRLCLPNLLEDNFLYMYSGAQHRERNKDCGVPWKTGPSFTNEAGWREPGWLLGHFSADLRGICAAFQSGAGRFFVFARGRLRCDRQRFLASIARVDNGMRLPRLLFLSPCSQIHDSGSSRLGRIGGF